MMKILFWIIIIALIVHNWKYLLLALAVFAILYLTYNKTNSKEITLPSVSPSTNDTPILDDRYQNILLRRPQLSNFVEGDYNDAFDDSYHTPEGYKLRELLLLVWWGKSQKGKALDVRIPKYYYDRYKLNPNEVTKRFFADGLLEYDETKDLVRSTTAGKELQQKYSKLWEIHSLKEYHANLDKEFTNWDIDKFLLTRHKQKIEYLKASSQFYDDMANFLRKNYPKEEQDILYYQDAKRTDQSNISKLKELLDNLEE
ncbi:hypothetical protein [Streptococcus jiangjianxini]|uniref:hypothetical protein n=1 Tax=Streptococcus jiangjianxini TaxID=3161189 RepID=UPI0032EE1884